LNIKDKNGDTPLHLAVRSGSLEAARALIEAGADLSLANNEGDTPLQLALELGKKDAAKALQEAGAV
jgi:ankyrin repeat protein